MSASNPITPVMECLIHVHLLWPAQPSPVWLQQVQQDLTFCSPSLGASCRFPRVNQVPSPAPFRGECTRIEATLVRATEQEPLTNRWLSRTLSGWLDNWQKAHPAAVFWVSAVMTGPTIVPYQAVIAGSGLAMPQQEVPRIALWEQFFDDESLRRGGWDADASVRPPEARALEVVRELTHASGLGPLLEFASRHLQARRLEGCWPNAQVIQIPVRF